MVDTQAGTRLELAVFRQVCLDGRQVDNFPVRRTFPIFLSGRLWRGTDVIRQPVSITPFQTVLAVFRHTAYR